MIRNSVKVTAGHRLEYTTTGVAYPARKAYRGWFTIKDDRGDTQDISRSAQKAFFRRGYGRKLPLVGDKKAN